MATTHGYEELERWSRGLGEIHAFGIEGTGSYGAGVARFLTSRGYNVVEVNRPDRSTRYRKGKSDPTDAEMAARAVLAGVADATPKSGEGEVEMIRMLESAKDSAVKARTQAINQMKALVVTAPAELRETLDGLAAGALVTRCKSFRTGRLDGPLAAARYTLRSLARRYRQLSEEVRDLEAELDRLTRTAAPALVDGFGIGPDTAATLLIAAGGGTTRTGPCGACRDAGPPTARSRRRRRCGGPPSPSPAFRLARRACAGSPGSSRPLQLPRLSGAYALDVPDVLLKQRRALARYAARARVAYRNNAERGHPVSYSGCIGQPPSPIGREDSIAIGRSVLPNPRTGARRAATALS